MTQLHSTVASDSVSPPVERAPRSRASFDISQLRMPSWRSRPTRSSASPAIAEPRPRVLTRADRRDRQAEKSAQAVVAIVKGASKDVKDVGKLKRDLLETGKARRIVGQLKQIDARNHDEPRGVCLQSTDEEVMATAKTADDGKLEPSAVARFQLFSLSPGALLASAAQSTGAFNVLADVTTTLIANSAGHDGSVTPPPDRMSVYIYYWGYELVLPPKTIATLGRAHNMSGSVFGFLTALSVAGGAPELQPFIRYISAYIDMEWSSIRSQNKGHGVVLAATWLIPIALIARPYDFPMPTKPAVSC